MFNQLILAQHGFHIRGQGIINSLGFRIHFCSYKPSRLISFYGLMSCLKRGKCMHASASNIKDVRVANERAGACGEEEEEEEED